MPPEAIQKELAEQRLLLEHLLQSVERTRKYFLWTLIAGIAVLVLPLIGLLFALPSFIQNYTSALQGF